MRGVTWVVLVAFLVSGCAEPSDGPGQDPASTGPVPGTEDGEGPDVPEGPAPAEPGAQVLRFDQANMSYENQVQRFRLTAEAPTGLQIEWDARWAGVSWRGACMAGTVLHQQTNGTRYLFGGAAWSVPSNLGAEVRVAGQSFQVPGPDAQDQSAGVANVLRAEADLTLAPGESIVIALGGTTPEAFQWENPGGEDSRSTLTVRVDGRARLEEQEPRALACGVGARGAEDGTAGASFYLVDAEAGGRVGFTSRNASTAWLLGQSDRTPEPVLHFLDEPPRPVVGEVRVASVRAGDMALEFPAKAGTIFEQPAWLFVDDHWVLPS